VHLHESNLVILATAWPEYQSIIEEFLRSGPNVIILDPYRIVHASSIVEDRSRLIQLGIHEK